MKIVKDFMFDMFAAFMPFFSYNLVFSLVILASAGMVVLFVGKENIAKIGIRFAIWSVVSIILLLFVLGPVLSLFQRDTNSFSILSPFIHLQEFPNFGKLPLLKFLLTVFPFIIIISSILILIFRSSASALGIGRFLLVMGIIFIVCQLMGGWLGANASVNFGDFSGAHNEKHEWQSIIVAFWKLGVGMIIVGSALSISGRMARDRAILDV